MKPYQHYGLSKPPVNVLGDFEQRTKELNRQANAERAGREAAQRKRDNRNLVLAVAIGTVIGGVAGFAFGHDVAPYIDQGCDTDPQGVIYCAPPPNPSPTEKLADGVIFGLLGAMGGSVLGAELCVRRQERRS